MSRPLRLLICACILAIAAPLAAAQAPTPVATVTVTVDEGPYEILPGENGTFSFHIEIVIDNLACSEGGSVILTFESKETGMASMPNTPIDDLQFDIPQGVYLADATGTWSADTTIEVPLSVLPEAPPEHVMPYRYDAAFDGKTGCDNEQALNKDNDEFLIKIDTGPAPPPPEPEPPVNETLNTTADDDVEPEEESPAPPAAFIAMALTALAAVASRRRS